MKKFIAVLGLTLLLSGVSAFGQTEKVSEAAEARSAQKPETRSGPPEDARPTKVFYLKNANQPSQGNEILTSLRLLLDPVVKLYLVPSQNAIIVRGSATQIALAQQLLAEEDRPKKLYRLTYTVSESEAGKRVGIMHYTIVASSGERATLKQGSRVPIVTGSYDPSKNGAQTQFTYLDIGMNFDMTAIEITNGVTLKVKVEQSSIADGESRVGSQDPIVRQAVIDETAETPLGKPLVLGSLDIQGSPRHLDVEVVVDEIR